MGAAIKRPSRLDPEDRFEPLFGEWERADGDEQWW